jgi:hypothetical protein
MFLHSCLCVACKLNAAAAQIEFGFYIKLDPTRLLDLHYKYASRYLQVVEDVAINAVRVCSVYFSVSHFQK